MNLLGNAQVREWQAEGWAIPATVNEFLSLFDDFPEPVRELIAAVPGANLFKWGLRDREPLAKWTCGRVAMLGDAAHPMTPYLGQGACMAIEDGYTLAAAIARMPDELGAALMHYEQLRLPRTRRAVLGARARGEEMHLTSPWAQLKRNVKMALKHRLGGDKTGIQLGWFYNYDVAAEHRIPISA